MSTLDSIFGKLDDIIHLPLNKQAEYSDHSILNAVAKKDYDFLRRQVFRGPDKHYPQWNSVSLGGFSHIASYCDDPEIKTEALNLVNGYLDWYKA